MDNWEREVKKVITEEIKLEKAFVKQKAITSQERGSGHYRQRVYHLFCFWNDDTYWHQINKWVIL